MTHTNKTNFRKGKFVTNFQGDKTQPTAAASRSKDTALCVNEAPKGEKKK